MDTFLVLREGVIMGLGMTVRLNISSTGYLKEVGVIYPVEPNNVNLFQVVS